MNETIIKQLIESYGSPLYVFNKEIFSQTFKKLYTSFTKYYQKFNIAYSYKTNYIPAICATVNELNGYAEVVSAMEAKLARTIGVNPQHILFNGPSKENNFIPLIKDGGIIIVDNIVELESIRSFAAKNPSIECNIGIRLNFDIGVNIVSRFGFDTSSDDFKKVLYKIKNTANMRLRGIQYHMTGARSLSAWKKRAEKMLALADTIFDTPPDFIDLGSGMYGEMTPELAKQFSPSIPSFDDYAKTVCQLFAKHYEKHDERNKPLLLVEPGTTLAANAMSFIAQVTSIKNNQGKNFATLNASIHNLGILSQKKNLPLKIFTASKEYFSNIDFVGYTCLEYDCMYRGYQGNIAVNDFILFENIGSYSIVLKPPFIRPNVAVVMYNDNKEFVLIKKPETFDDIFKTYIY